MPDLTNPQDSLKLLHSLLSKSTDTLTQRQKDTSSTEKSTVSVDTDTALTPTAVTPTVSAPSVHALTVTKPVQHEENTAGVSASVRFGDKSLRDGPWPLALEQAEALAARLAELGAEVIRIDIDGKGSRGYRTLKGLAHEQVHQLVRWLLSELAKRYPTPSHVVVIAQGHITPGCVPNTPLWQWSAEHQPVKPEPERKPPQLAPWAAGLLEDADRLGVAYPLLLELRGLEDGVQSLTRLAESRAELERILAELSCYSPLAGHLREPKTLTELWGFVHI